MSRTIIYATGNASKIEMMKNLFPHDEVLSLKDIHFDREIVENGTTFQENAMIKAQAVQDFLKAQGKEYSVIIYGTNSNKQEREEKFDKAHQLQMPLHQTPPPE